MVADKLHPCQKCGACCSIFQVAFRSHELSANSFHVPSEFAVKISDEMMALKHQNPNKPRCRALKGHIGQEVGCQIYDRRPSPCRNFSASYENGEHNARCDAARARMGLAPLTTSDWSGSLEASCEN